MEQEVPLQLGNYRLGQTLGKGTFGKVKIATHLPTQELVAIKILDKLKIEDEDDRVRILREIQILRKVRHPNICQLYQVLEDSRNIYLVTEYCEEGELLNYISRRKRLKEKNASRFINQITNALLYLYRLGIVHRDLKPENILLDFNFNVKLIDFGLSNYSSQGTYLETACGSPCYASPEMVSGVAYDGFKSDAWSLGVILFVMVCGELPFEEKTTKELYNRIISGEHKRIPDYLRRETVDMIRGLLNTNPERRITLLELRQQPFCLMTAEQEPEVRGIAVGKHPMPIDLELLDELRTKLAFEAREGEEEIRRNRHTPITTAYYLMQKKVLREGGKTVLELQLYLERISVRDEEEQEAETVLRSKRTGSRQNTTRVRNRSRSIEQSLRKYTVKIKPVKDKSKLDEVAERIKSQLRTERIHTEGNEDRPPSLPNKKKPINILYKIMPSQKPKLGKEDFVTPTKKRIFELSLGKEDRKSLSLYKKRTARQAKEPPGAPQVRTSLKERESQSPKHKKRNLSIVGAAKVQIRINKPIFINR